MPTTATIPLFDPAQLNRHARGDARLEVEALSLFAAEAERLMDQVEDAPDSQVRTDRVRALIGVARNIGAARIAQEARALEAQIVSERPDLSALKRAIAETVAFVRRSG